MADWSLQKKGFDELIVRLNKAGDPRVLEGAMRESLKVVQQDASRFPPQPSRTRSKHFNTWVRERGQLPRSAFGISAKTGKTTIRHAGRAVYRVSEKLIQKWKTAQPQIRVGVGYIVGRITNAASYGVWVQGEKQTKWHKSTGWKTVNQILASKEQRILAVFRAAVKKMLG